MEGFPRRSGLISFTGTLVVGFCLYLIYPDPKWLRYLVSATFVGLSFFLFLNPLKAQSVQELFSPAVGDKVVISTPRWFWVGFCLLLFSLAMIESIDPYYFTQDDNLVEHFPIILNACRGILKGEWPSWSPFQYLGMPYMESAFYSLTYPITYFCFFVARFVLGNEFLTIDVYAWLHLFLGYFAVYKLLLKLRIREEIAASGGLSYVLSGFFLIAGRSWYYMLPTAVWWPVLVLCFLELVDTYSLKPLRWVIKTALAVGFYFHSGNATMWFYGVCFFILLGCFANLAGALTKQRLIYLLLAIVVGIGFSQPTMAVQYFFSKDVRRWVYGEGITEGLYAQFLPFPFVQAPHPNHWGNRFLEYAGQIYYSGTIFSFTGWMVAYLIFALVLVKKSVGSVFKKQYWLLLWIFVFGLALGHQGYLWDWAVKLPIMNKFTNPLKFMAYWNLLSIILGGMFLDRILREMEWGKWLGRIIFCLVSVLLIYHSGISRHSFYYYADKPYPNLPEKFQQILKTDFDKGFQSRVMSYAPDREYGLNYAYSLKHHFPSVYEIPVVEGYDLLVEGNPEQRRVRWDSQNPLPSMRAYGVRWIVAQRASIGPGSFLRNYIDSHIEEIHSRGGWGDVELFEVQEPEALAFLSKGEPLITRLFQSHVEIELPELPAPSTLTLNFLWREKLRLLGSRGDILIVPDSFGRVVARFEKGLPAQTLRLDYQIQWWKYSLIGFFISGLGLMGVWLVGLICLKNRHVLFKTVN